MQRTVRNNSGHQDTGRCGFVGARSDGKIASPGITEKKRRERAKGEGSSARTKKSEE